MGSNKGKKFPAEVLTPDEVRRLLTSCDRRSISGVRAKAMIMILYRGGLRCSEMLDLRKSDLNQDSCTVRIRHGKGDLARTVGVDSSVFDVVETWVRRRKELELKRESPLFCSRHGRKLPGQYVRKLCTRLGARASIEKRVHPHGFRHTLASELCQEGVPLTVIQAQLGHLSAATTDQYLRQLSPTQVIETMKTRNWVA